MKSAKTNNHEVRILKIATSPSLSGNSTLTYHVGCLPDSEIQIRIYANTASGFFSNEWVSMSVIQELFAKVPADKPITSSVLSPLFQGKSVNTPSFLFAALKQEGFITLSSEQQRKYERSTPTIFLEEVSALIASDTDLKVEDKPAVPAATAKKTASIRPKSERTPANTGKKSPTADGKDQKATDANPKAPGKKTSPKTVQQS